MNAETMKLEFDFQADSLNAAAIKVSKTLPEDRRFDFIRYVMKGEADEAFREWLHTDKAGKAAQQAMADWALRRIEIMNNPPRDREPAPQPSHYTGW